MRFAPSEKRTAVRRAQMLLFLIRDICEQLTMLCDFETGVEVGVILSICHKQSSRALVVDLLGFIVRLLRRGLEGDALGILPTWGSSLLGSCTRACKTCL